MSHEYHRQQNTSDVNIVSIPSTQMHFQLLPVQLNLYSDFLSEYETWSSALRLLDGRSGLALEKLSVKGGGSLRTLYLHIHVEFFLASLRREPSLPQLHRYPAGECFRSAHHHFLVFNTIKWMLNSVKCDRRP
jgi:hypothetical protein